MYEFVPDLVAAMLFLAALKMVLASFKFGATIGDKGFSFHFFTR